MNFNQVFILLCLVFLTSCFSNDESKYGGNNANKNQTIEQPKSHCKLKVENVNKTSKNVWGDIMEISIVCDSIQIDSAIIKVAEKKVGVVTPQNPFLKFDTKKSTVGNISVMSEIFFDGKKEFKSSSFILYSDIDPVVKSYKIVKTYKHDVNAYTQGLVYENGCFYESTGLYRESSLRKVKLETGEILQSFLLPAEFFGEGLALIDNKLVQLTWKNQKGFVYDKQTFSKIGEFQIFTEGWGLSPYGDTLLLTDGTENMFFLEKNSFSVQKNIQVYDNNGPVKMLNETEVIGNLIYANIYQKDLIAVIDLNTGKVLNYINLAGILPANLVTNQTDVLNGIAYDKDNDRFFVTGKKWPLLFEIKIN